MIVLAALIMLATTAVIAIADDGEMKKMMIDRTMIILMTL